jgi:Ni2+-binding GTPase involved in maturation of urease and hydrogenase
MVAHVWNAIVPLKTTTLKRQLYVRMDNISTIKMTLIVDNIYLLSIYYQMTVIIVDIYHQNDIDHLYPANARLWDFEKK